MIAEDFSRDHKHNYGAMLLFVLTGVIVGRGHLHHISGDDVEALHRSN